MNLFNVLLSVTLVLACCAISLADSLVISFEDGKTQTVTLDGSIKSIKAVQYLPSSDKAQSAPVLTEPPANRATSTPKPGVNAPQQQQNPDKSVVKFKWAEPVIGQ